MNFKNARIIALLISLVGVVWAEVSSDLINTRSDTTLSVSKPLLVGGASLLLPGAGQFYTKHYVKAGTFLALEAITASVSYYWYQTASSREEEAELFFQTALKDTGIGKVKSLEQARLMKGSVLDARFKSYNALSWCIGGYVFNVLDALAGTKIFHDDAQKDPLVAAWLSAVPGLGLGQFYNGSVSKAGLVLMTQTSLGIVAYNHHRLMRKAETQYGRLSKEIRKIDNIRDPESVAYSDYRADWDSKRRNALRNRNTYLWYSLFFYLYGIFDAVVDAHLHDYNDKMRIYPDLVPQNGGAQLNMNISF